MIQRVELPGKLRAQLLEESRRAFPRECCGLIVGFCDGVTARTEALHPTANLARVPDRFEIDPAAHIALLRGLRGSGRNIMGCYHSHPNGKAQPSPRDLESAAEEGFLWLIAALDARDAEPRIAAFVYAGSAFAPLQIENP